MKPKEKSLLKIFRDLSNNDQESVQSFADFLRSRDTGPKIEDTPAVIIPRPENESVIAAMRRLSASYPMLEKPSLLNETSTLMTQHVMQGKDAVAVIDELETLFLTQYENFLGNNSLSNNISSDNGSSNSGSSNNGSSNNGSSNNSSSNNGSSKKGPSNEKSNSPDEQ